MLRVGLVIIFLAGAIAALVFASYDICDVSDLRFVIGVVGSGVCLGGAAWAFVGLRTSRRWIQWATGIAVTFVGGFLVLVLLFLEWVSHCTA